jgi:hypothetical protein
MKRILLSVVMLCALQSPHALCTKFEPYQENRQLFIQLLFPNSSSGKPLLETRLLQESPSQTIRGVRIQVARSLGIWPSLIKVSDRKGRPLPDHLKIGYDIGRVPQDPLRMFVDVGVQKIRQQVPQSDFVDSTFLQ